MPSTPPPTPPPTLADAIAAGHRLLAGTPPAVRGHRLDDVARLADCDPWTVGEHLRHGTLHGHVESGEWRVRPDVLRVFLEGLGPARQRRVCGCGARLRVVRGSRTGAGSSAAPPSPRPAGDVVVHGAARPALSVGAPTLEA